MATSITAAGIVFPDSSVQTTAAFASGGTTEAIASGALSDGSTVIVNADGTVSVISGTAQAVGSRAEFTSSGVVWASSVYDQTNNKIVIAYQDAGNSYFGVAIVGTVSGMSISFGTPVVFSSGQAASHSITFDSNANKVVIAYKDEGNSNYGTAIVGTVSGTSISFGTAVTFSNFSANRMSATYDSTNNKVVIIFGDTNNSEFGTAIVGTVSGTSISFGTPVVFESGQILYNSITFDSTNDKIVIVYENATNLDYGTAIVGTVSGTSISFGASVVFESAGVGYISSVYDATNNKVIIAYTDEGNSNYGTAIVGTVSGTSISFGTAVVFENAHSIYNSVTHDPANNKIVIAYSDVGNSSRGTVIVGVLTGTSIVFSDPVVFNTSTTDYISMVYDVLNNKIVIIGRNDAVVFQNESTNLTSENFIGISDGAYADTAIATIQIAGAVDDAQSGLTPGQAYYVQGDGTLSETPGTPSVFAGTAISATKIVVQG